jgi:hypothetical protein
MKEFMIIKAIKELPAPQNITFRTLSQKYIIKIYANVV